MLPQTILIIAATEGELSPARELLGGSAENISFAATGAGKVSAAIATLELISQLRPDWIIQLGCAGAYPGSGLGIADVAIANLEIFADEGVETPEGFLSMRDLELPQASRDGELIFNEVPVDFPTAETIQEIRSSLGQQSRIEAGLFCTVSRGSGTDAASRRVEERWNPLVESMEGAAAALVAWRQRVRFSEIRGISNMTGDRNRESWQVAEACEAAAATAGVWIEREKTQA
jgi:futalosine hydrolase